MTEKQMIDEIAGGAQELKNAIEGLNSFVMNRFGATDVTIDDISALSGLVAAIRSLAVHNQEVTENYRLTMDIAKHNDKLIADFIKND